MASSRICLRGHLWDLLVGAPSVNGRLAMISPYVRRLRLGTELRALRAEHNMNQDRVARLIGKSRMDISRLESGQSADQGSVLDILEALSVEGERWAMIAAIASAICFTRVAHHLRRLWTRTRSTGSPPRLP